MGPNPPPNTISNERTRLAKSYARTPQARLERLLNEVHLRHLTNSRGRGSRIAYEVRKNRRHIVRETGTVRKQKIEERIYAC